MRSYDYRWFSLIFVIFAIFRVMGDASGAPAGSTGGVARCHLERLGIGYDKKKKKKSFENFFFDEKKNRKNPKIENRKNEN